MVQKTDCDPSMGQFLNEDTYEGQIDNPLSLNLYTYVSNNPLKYIDPTGNRQCIYANSCDVKETRAPGFWESEWNAIKAAHSSWFSAIDFWTAGLLSETKEYARISQEDTWSVRHFASAALLMMNFWPGGKFEKQSADLTATIWGRITATQSVRQGTYIPTSFVLEDITVNGNKLWVHGNATKHMEEYMRSENISMLSNDAQRMIQ
ncbi:RHS repeat-associated core domain-containing protein [Paenibacillus graminis]|nr:RHS repeat-associated core domain-containing protein [Paenibacillus graminis]